MKFRWYEKILRAILKRTFMCENCPCLYENIRPCGYSICNGVHNMSFWSISEEGTYTDTHVFERRTK